MKIAFRVPLLGDFEIDFLLKFNAFITLLFLVGHIGQDPFFLIAFNWWRVFVWTYCGVGDWVFQIPRWTLPVIQW